MNEIRFIETTITAMAEFVSDRYRDRTQLVVNTKTDPNDVVTEIDLATQHQIVQRIADQFPGDTVVAEEANLNVLPATARGRHWILDPIDGTQNFVRGLFPAFGISLALAQDGVVCAGGVALPGTGDLFLAERGQGAFRSGAPSYVSGVQAIEIARIDVDFSINAHREGTLQKTSRIICAAGQIRSYCSAVVALCSVASGEAEAYVHISLNPWDYAAGMLLVQEAGGQVTRLDGSPVHIFDGRKGLLATNSHTHQQFLDLL